MDFSLPTDIELEIAAKFFGPDEDQEDTNDEDVETANGFGF